jgi:hypothetical protein
LLIPSPFEHYPPKWELFDRYTPLLPMRAFGFVGAPADVNRFAARYRAAKCFKRIEFSDLSADTADGYSAMCHCLLTYSAFEFLLRAMGLELKATASLLTDNERDKLLANLRRCVGQVELFTALRKHVEARFQRQIDAHVAGHACNPFYLAAAIRHTFAHGILAATPVGVPPRSAATVSRFFSRVLFRVMDREFERRMRELEQMMTGA